MQDEVVSYELAVLLWLLGFDWECIHSYTIEQTQSNEGVKKTISELCSAPDETGALYFEEQELKTLREENPERKYVLAPFHAQALKWFREVHNIHIAIIPSITFKQDWEEEIMYKGSIYMYEGRHTSDYSDNYEGATETALTKACGLCKKN